VTFIILLSVLCSSLAHTLLKIGMSATTKDAGSAIELLRATFLNPFVVSGVALHVFALLTWLYALRRADLSYAYPFIALGFVLVMAISHYALHEEVSAGRIAGAGLIVVGVLFTSIS
jgi:drug/metabolite transporter (DMT)-like permease